MIDKTIIWYSPKHKGYYSKGAIDCLSCKKQESKVFIYALHFLKRSTKIETFCANCFKKINNIGIIDEYKIVTISEKIPSDSYPIFDRPPNLKSVKDLSVFEAAKDKLIQADKVIDRTRVADRESWSGVKVGYSPKSIEDVKDVGKYLTELKASRPLIPAGSQMYLK